MPIYEFSCLVCKAEFEEIVISPLDVIACGCGSRDVVKLMSIPAPARIVDFVINPDKGGRFRLDDATFHPSVKDPLPWDKCQGIKTYEMDFGKTEKQKLESKVSERRSV